MAAPCENSRLTVTVAKCFELIWACCLLQLLLGATCHEYEEFGGYLLCRKCGYEVAKAADLISMPSVNALRQRNDTFSGTPPVLIQLFMNPHGVYFELMTTVTAEVETSSEKFAADSWFPGYVWSIAKCPRCGAHVGWLFTAVSKAPEEVVSRVLSFVGLIIDKVMHEDEVNNLIAMPKTYAS